MATTPGQRAAAGEGRPQRLHGIIRGRVQGVGFRDATWREARRLGLAGWVRNRMDGTVEVQAEGEVGPLRALEAFLRQGPPMANVTGADIFWEEEAPVNAPATGGQASATKGGDTAGDGLERDRAGTFEIR